MDWSLILLQLTLPHCGLRGSSKPLRPAIVLRTVMKVSFSVCCDMQALLLFALGPSYSLILFCCVHGHVFSFDFYNVELICKYGWMEQSCGISAISKLYIASIYYPFVFFTLQAITLKLFFCFSLVGVFGHCQNIQSQLLSIGLCQILMESS